MVEIYQGGDFVSAIRPLVRAQRHIGRIAGPPDKWAPGVYTYPVDLDTGSGPSRPVRLERVAEVVPWWYQSGAGLRSENEEVEVVRQGRGSWVIVGDSPTVDEWTRAGGSASVVHRIPKPGKPSEDQVDASLALYPNTIRMEAGTPPESGSARGHIQEMLFSHNSIIVNQPPPGGSRDISYSPVVGDSEFVNIPVTVGTKTHTVSLRVTRSTITIPEGGGSASVVSGVELVNGAIEIVDPDDVEIVEADWPYTRATSVSLINPDTD